jgi:hypothetical protein
MKRFHDVMYFLHLGAAGALACGVALIVVMGHRRALRVTARELRSLQVEDREWLRAVPARVFEGAPEPPAGRFNAGQKVNFIGVCVLLAALYISGVDTVIAGTHHNLIFAVHKVSTVALCMLVAGHLYMALVNRATRPALRDGRFERCEIQAAFGSGVETCGTVSRPVLEARRPLRMASPKFRFIEVGAAQRPVVGDPRPNRVLGPSDGPAIREAHLAHCLAAPCFIGRKKVVGNLLVEQEDEIESAPA